jgi:hypothetical protein
VADRGYLMTDAGVRMRSWCVGYQEVACWLVLDEGWTQASRASVEL